MAQIIATQHNADRISTRLVHAILRNQTTFDPDFAACKTRNMT